MKNAHKMAVLGSALGLLVSGAYAAGDRMNPMQQFGENPTMYEQLIIEQHADESAMASRGARGPVRTETMEHAQWLGESPTLYDQLIADRKASEMSAPRGARGPVREDLHWSGESPSSYDFGH